MIITINYTAKSQKLEKPYIILTSCRRTVHEFSQTFDNIRRQRNARGVATDPEQDILRAMLLFSSSGTDSMIKQVVNDTLHIVIEKDEGARAQFRAHVEKNLLTKKDGEVEIINKKLLTDIFLHNSPKQALVENLKKHLTAESLQSKDQIYKVASFFNISSKNLFADDKKLKAVFEARNQIAHEMDVDFTMNNRNRRQRAKPLITEYCNDLLKLSLAFIKEVDEKIKP